MFTFYYATFLLTTLSIHGTMKKQNTGQRKFNESQVNACLQQAVTLFANIPITAWIAIQVYKTAKLAQIIFDPVLCMRIKFETQPNEAKVLYIPYITYF